ncbi:MAG: hypothetical protein U9N06_06800 [candidate division WOR-3 bacterium]|nr:hypothetical protein [candidate division WOR-3 bacterium]
MNILRVEFYSGTKRNEIPRNIFTDSGVIRVKKIIETRLEEDYESGKRRRIFIFRSWEGSLYRLESIGEELRLIELGD